MPSIFTSQFTVIPMERVLGLTLVVRESLLEMRAPKFIVIGRTKFNNGVPCMDG